MRAETVTGPPGAGLPEAAAGVVEEALAAVARVDAATEAPQVVMPKKAESGSTTIDLLDYLFGPRERDEHVDPHLVAGWDPDLPCPARDPGRTTLADLALLLDAPVEALRGPKPAEHVWHVLVRNHADDRVLSDDEWSDVAAAGIAGHGDEQACRWTAVRHATDPIHPLAPWARQDGRHPRVLGDIRKLHAAARQFQAR